MTPHKRRWEELGLTHEQFCAVVATMGPSTPNNVIKWWFLEISLP